MAESKHHWISQGEVVAAVPADHYVNYATLFKQLSPSINIAEAVASYYQKHRWPPLPAGKQPSAAVIRDAQHMALLHVLRQVYRAQKLLRRGNGRTAAYQRAATETKAPQAPMPKLRDIATAIGVAVADWPGRCYEIARRAVEAGLFPGAHVGYGHYHGPIAPTSMFATRVSSHHGWIVLADGRIADPTRWVFEAVRPYLYVGTAYEQYDLAGNKLNRMLLGDEPPPGPEEVLGRAKQPCVTPLALKEAAAIQYLIDVVGTTPDAITEAQIYWVAHRMPEELGIAAKPLYLAMQEADLKGWIPLDNWNAVMGETTHDAGNHRAKPVGRK
jgi:hypothetical protein